MPTPNSDPLLTYAFATLPAPLLTSKSDSPERAKLTIVATNSTSAPVELSAIIIDLPVGQAASQLTNNAISIKPIPPAGWRCDLASESGLARFRFVPLPPLPPLPPSTLYTLEEEKALVFEFEKLEPNTKAGTSLVLVHEGGSTPVRDPDMLPTKTLEVTKFESGWGRLTFNVDKLHVEADQEVTLSWTGPVGPTYELEYQDYAGDDSVTVRLPKPPQPPFSSTGTYPGLRPVQTTTYTLIVTDRAEGYSRKAYMQLTVEVTQKQIPDPSIVKFKAEPALVINDGSTTPPFTVTLSWETDSASSLFIDFTDEQKPANIAKGSKIVRLANNKRYVAQAYPLRDSRERKPATTVIGVVVAEYIKTHREYQCHIELLSKEFLMTSSSDIKDNIYRYFFNLSKGRGYTIADLGILAERPTLFKPSYADVLAAKYQDRLENNLYMSGTMGSAAYTIHIAKGQTWAIRLSNTRLGILYYDGLKGDELEFLWIWCDDAYQNQLLAAAPQPSEA